MKSPYRRPSRIARVAHQSPLLLATAIGCAVVVAVAGTVFFVLPAYSKGSSGYSTGPGGPNLNPYSMEIFGLESTIAYTGGSSGYFPALNGTDLCSPVCPVLPALKETRSGWALVLPIFYNVTNANATMTERLGLPTFGISGANQTVFTIQLLCCYSAIPQNAYTEVVTPGTTFAPGSDATGSTFGFEALVFAYAAVPDRTDGGYTLYYNFTAP